MRKISLIFLIVILLKINLNESLSKELSSFSRQPSLTPQFYAGISIGLQRLTGRRNEYVVYEPRVPIANPAETIPFSDRSFSNNNGYYSAHVGLTWDVPRTALFVGGEIYLGRGSATTALKEAVFDEDRLDRNLNASMRQLTFWGSTLQFGLNCPSDSKVYFLTGIEKSQFEYSGTYSPRSQIALHRLRRRFWPGPDANFPPTVLNTRRWLRGLFWGFGVEKQIHSIRIGADIRFIHYKRFNAQYAANAVEPEVLFSSFALKNARFSLRISYLF